MKIQPAKRGESRSTEYEDEKGNKVSRPFSLNFAARKGYPFGKKTKREKAA